MKIVISSGHGKYVSGASGIVDEVTEARRVVSCVVGYFKQSGLSVVEYHDDTSKNKADNVNGIVAFHNRQSRDIDVSVHFNACKKTDLPVGVEVLYYTEAALAAKISKAIADASGLKNRGAKKRVDLGFLARTAKPAVLIEVCFVDSSADVAIYRTKFDEICKAIAEAISGATIVNTPNLPSGDAADQTGLSVLSHTQTTPLQAQKWAENKGATIIFQKLADDYWALAEPHGGVNPALAYAQSALETGYGKFGGVLDESYCNPCGLKTTAGGGDADKSAHKRFSSWAEGLKAHLDHLALYAGAKGYPRTNSPDPRHFPYLLGVGKTIGTMARSWCPSNVRYAQTLVRMMDEMAAVPEAVKNEVTADRTTILFNGKEIQCERILQNGTNYIKLRELEKFGASVSYNADRNMPVIDF